MVLTKPFAVGLGRATHWGLRTLARRPASQLPGRVALALEPNIVAYLAQKLTIGSIVVCGTNGKTTTNNVLAAALEDAGLRVLCNNDGANMEAGVASALLPGRTADWAVLEVDELSTIRVLPKLRPRYLVLLNLFRDQLDRAGEIDHVQDVIVDALAASPNTVLVTCADDPLCMAVAIRARREGTHVVTFGVGEGLGLVSDRVPEARFCQFCGSELSYEYRTYAQLGSFRCPQGDFERPRPDFVATDVRTDLNGVSFLMSGASSFLPQRIESGLGGVYSVYNLLAAAAASSLAGVGARSVQQTLRKYHSENGRLQHYVVDGREVVLNLAKNPTGFNQNISLLLTDDRPKVVFFVINDNGNDGRDISWIWDVDFERLADKARKEEIVVLAGGLRAQDVRVRLKYAGVSKGADAASSVREAVNMIEGVPRSWPLYVLCNYSALAPAHEELARMGEGHE